MRRRIMLVVLVVLVALLLVGSSGPASAQDLLDKVIGCKGALHWPCPGPAL